MGEINSFPRRNFYGKLPVSISSGVMKIPGSPKSYSKDGSCEKKEREESGNC